MSIHLSCCWIKHFHLLGTSAPTEANWTVAHKIAALVLAFALIEARVGLIAGSFCLFAVLACNKGNWNARKST